MTHEYPPNRAFDRVSISRVSALREYGLTLRQREFLVTVMVHSGCFLERQYCEFTGTVRGQNSREFMAKLVTRGFARAIEPGAVRRGRLYHVQHKPLYEAIGLADNRNRRLCTIGRMVERVMILDAVLGDRRRWWLSPEADKRAFFDATQQNLSLPTQLRACEEYCRRHGFEILQRFHEQGESAKTTDRSELQNLLKYCRTHKGKVHFVIVYNLTRFAREKYDHFALRAHLKSLGISLRSATEPIDDTSTGKLMEGVLAAFAQFDNDVRSDRTRAGMRAALELGRWTFPAPLGYLNAPKWSGRSLVHDPDRAELLKRAFEDLATGRYTKQEVIARATAAGLRSRKGLTLSPQSFGQLMRNPIYVGRIESPDYGVSTRGDFEPIVDEATFYRAQAVLNGRVVVAGPRQRNHPDFPLRNFVRCEACGRSLTGSWSKGRNGRYAYYHCQRQCRAINVSKAVLEGAFVDELAFLQPTAGYMRLVKDRILHVWEERRAEASERTTEQERRVKAIHALSPSSR